KAGLPIEVPAVTVNRLCGSGFEAITQGAQLILLGEAEAVLCGGAESMSQAPHVVHGARWGLRLGPPAPLEDLLWEALKDPQCGLSMAETAEKLAEKYKLTRREVDEVALGSQQRAKKAWDDCVFQDEVVAVPVKVNEAFAPQYLAVERELGLDRARTKVHGGAIAIGHPLAASGTRITIHLLHALRQRKGRFGLGSACIGGGQGAAVVVEAFPT